MIKHLLNLNFKQILFLAIFLRVLWACFVAVDPVGDSVVYDQFALSIASGNGYAWPDGSTTVYWPVGTSAIYGLLYYFFGQSYHAVAIFNLIIGTMIVVLTYGVAKQHLSERVASIAALLVAVWPILIQFTTIHASELFFIFLVLAALYTWGNQRIPPIVRAIFWGALICAATYIRPTALPLLGLLPLLQWFKKESIGTCLTAFITATLSAAILFSPWVYRNYQHFGQFVLISANGGANLWMGNHEGSNGGYVPLPSLDFKDEVVRDKYYKKEAIDYIKAHPLQYLKLGVLRAHLTYRAETIGIVWNGDLYKKLGDRSILTLKLLSTIYWWAMLIIAAIGLYQLLRKRELSIFSALPATFGFFFVFPLLTVGQDRYHLPIDPFLAIFSAYAIQGWLTKNSAKPAQHSASL